MAFHSPGHNDSTFVTAFRSNPRNDLCIFGKGYYRAAVALSERLLAKDPFPDYEAYPIVFLYRQSLELYLKGLLYKIALLAALKDIEGIDPCFHASHRLLPFAEALERACRRLFPNDGELAAVVGKTKRVAAEFEEIDPISQSYRYPVDKEGKLSAKHHQVVSLTGLHKTMKEVLSELEVINFGMDVETTKAQDVYEILEELRKTLAQE